jgi:GNAT superfamily N-acetyltransferase
MMQGKRGTPMASYTIRPMEACDIGAGSRLMSQLVGQDVSADEMRNRLDFVNSSPIDWLFVVEAEGRVRGLMGFRLRERIERAGCYGEVSALVVDAEVRRQGIGRALLEYAEHLAHEHGCIGTWLVSGFRRAEEAHRFYAELGYEATGYRFVKLFE